MPESFSATVGATVRAELARRKRNQRELAEALGISQTQVSRRLAGEIAFNVDELAIVAAFLGVPMSLLIATAPVESPASAA